MAKRPKRPKRPRGPELPPTLGDFEGAIAATGTPMPCQGGPFGAGGQYIECGSILAYVVPFTSLYGLSMEQTLEAVRGSVASLESVDMDEWDHMSGEVDALGDMLLPGTYVVACPTCLDQNVLQYALSFLRPNYGWNVAFNYVHAWHDSPERKLLNLKVSEYVQEHRGSSWN